jgi:hypothetical protein
MQIEHKKQAQPTGHARHFSIRNQEILISRLTAPVLHNRTNL